MTTLFQNVLYLDGASGATTKRTPSTRGVDVINVKSFGATGDGVTDDTTAINNAIKSATSNWANGLCGMIFFPPGVYIVSSPLLPDVYQGLHSIIMAGVGQASEIRGNFSDFIIKAANFSTGGLLEIRDLLINNQSATGCGIQIYGTVNALIENCVVQAGICGIHSLQGNSVTCRQVQVVASNWPGGSCGVLMRGNGAIYMLDCTGWETGVRFHGGACALYGFRLERNKTGIELGRGQAMFIGSCSASTLNVTTMITDMPDGGGVYGNGPSGLAVGAALFGSGVPVCTITGLGTGAGRLGTYTLSTSVGAISSRNMWTLIDDQINGAVIECGTMESNDTGIYAFDASASRISACSIAGENSSPSGTGSWVGINCNNFANSVMESCSIASADTTSFQTAGIKINNCGGSLFQGVVAATNASAPGPAWSYGDLRFLPEFRLCNNPFIGASFANATLNPYPGRFAIFTDSPSTTVGATISTGAGTATVPAIYSGSNWKILSGSL